MNSKVRWVKEIWIDISDSFKFQANYLRYHSIEKNIHNYSTCCLYKFVSFSNTHIWISWLLAIQW